MAAGPAEPGQLAAHARIELPRPGGRCRSRCGCSASAPCAHQQTGQGAADHALRGRIGRQQLGMRGLHGLQLLEQAVVLGVRASRRVEHVVAVARWLQRLARSSAARAQAGSRRRRNRRTLAGAALQLNPPRAPENRRRASEPARLSAERVVQRFQLAPMMAMVSGASGCAVVVDDGRRPCPARAPGALARQRRRARAGSVWARRS